MYTWVSLRKRMYCTWFVIYNTCVCPKYMTIYIETRIYLLHTRFLSPQPAYSSCRCQKNTFFEIRVVWVVMQLTPSVVTTLSLTPSLQKGINRVREVHERRLESLHCYARGIGTLFAHTFSLEDFSLCCRAWRLSSLEKRSNITKSRFPTWREGIFVVHFMINKYGMSFFFPNHFLMCIWITILIIW